MSLNPYEEIQIKNLAWVGKPLHSHHNRYSWDSSFMSKLYLSFMLIFRSGFEKSLILKYKYFFLKKYINILKRDSENKYRVKIKYCNFIEFEGFMGYHITHESCYFIERRS